MSKPLWESRTFWVQVMSILIAVLSLFVDDRSLGLPDNWRAYLVMAVSILNIFLRVVTTVPIAGTQAARDRADGEG